MEDYEVVEEVNLGNMLPVCKVKTAGEMIADFAEKKEALQNYMNVRYGELVVNEATITSIKKDLAELRKVEKEIGTIIKTAKADFNKPIELTLAQAEEFKAVITDTINKLATKQKAVDEELQERKLREAKCLYTLYLGQYSPEIQGFASKCESWIIRPQWKNKTYTDYQIHNDCKQSLDLIQLALQIFQGKYRAQALNRFQQTGDLAVAQALVNELEEADRQEELRKQNESATKQPDCTNSPTMPVQEEPERLHLPEEPRVVAVEGNYNRPVIEVDDPDAYIQQDADKQVKTVNLSISAPSGVHKWILGILTIPENTTYKVISKQMIVSAAEKILAQERGEN